MAYLVERGFQLSTAPLRLDEDTHLFTSFATGPRWGTVGNWAGALTNKSRLS